MVFYELKKNNRDYFGRLKRVGQPPEQRTLKVDAEASKRFINNALSGDKVWKNANKTADAGIGRSNPAGQPENAQETARKTQQAFAKEMPGAKRKHAASSASEATHIAGSREEGHKSPDVQMEGRRTNPAGPRAKKANTSGSKTGKNASRRMFTWG